MSRFGSSDDDEENISDTRKIRICFTSKGGEFSDYFKAAESTKMKDLIEAFCKKRNIDYKFAKFFFAGKKLPYRGTVGEARLMDRDEIVVAIDQDGG